MTAASRGSCRSAARSGGHGTVRCGAGSSIAGRVFVVAVLLPHAGDVRRACEVAVDEEDRGHYEVEAWEEAGGGILLAEGHAIQVLLERQRVQDASDGDHRERNGHASLAGAAGVRVRAASPPCPGRSATPAAARRRWRAPRVRWERVSSGSLIVGHR